MTTRDRLGARPRFGAPCTGLVMSVSGRHAVVMVDGALHRIRLAYDGVRPGDEVIVPGRLLDAPRSRARFFRPLPVAVAAAALVVAMAVVLIGSPLPAVAHVSLDINPSVRLSVDMLMRVVAVSPYDEPSEAFLEGIDLVRRPLKESILVLTDRAAQFLQDSEYWLILGATSAEPDGEVPGRVMHTLDTALEQAEERWQAAGGHGEPLHGRVFPVPADVAEAASEAGVSPGCYVLQLAAQASGIDVSKLASDKAGAVLDAIRDGGLKPSEVLGKAGSDQEVKELWHNHGAQLRGKGKRSNSDTENPGKPGEAPVEPNDSPSSSEQPGNPGGSQKPDKPPAAGKDIPPKRDPPVPGKPDKDKPG